MYVNDQLRVGAELGMVVWSNLRRLAGVGAVDGAFVGAAVGDDVSHVGTASDDQPTEPTPTTLHVRVVVALIAKPTKQ